MGLHNTLKCKVSCPHCGRTSVVEAEFKFGLMDLSEYRIGDKIKWADAAGKGVRKPRSRPIYGNYTDVAYVECEFCNKDYFLDVIVASDIFVGVALSKTKGHIE